MAKSKCKVILSAAITIDGKIATKSGDSKLSSKSDKIRLHKLRSTVDAILVGKNTVNVDDPLLTVRYVKGKNPTRIILDSKGCISSNSKILKTCNDVPTIIVSTKQISNKNLKRLQKFPIKVLLVGEKTISLKKLLLLLYQQKINTILLEGGGTLNWEFIHQDLIDKLVITITPYIAGGDTAISLATGKGFENIVNCPKFQLEKVSRLKNELIIHYLKL